MQSLNQESEPDIWPQVAPLLEDAMARLGQKDRDAIVLRYFERQSYQEIARAAGATESAARQRVHHALAKLHRYLAKRGVVSSASALGGAIASFSVQAAPPELLHSLAAATLAKGAGLSASTLALVKATLKSLLWEKIKSALRFGVGLLVVGTAVTLGVVERDAFSAVPLVFSAQGTCRYTVFNSTGTETTVYPFTVSVSNQFWFMRITDVQSNAVTGYFEIGYNGERTYYVDYQEAWAKAAPLNRGTGSAENVAVGIIGPQQVPHFPFASQAGAIWLAYASTRYFDAAASASRLQPAASQLVLYGRNVQPNSFALQQAFWSRRPEPPGSLASAVYLDDGIAGLRAGQPVKWPPPLDVGFTNAVYAALAYTNLGALSLPTRATLTTFSPQPVNTELRVVPQIHLRHRNHQPDHKLALRGRLPAPAPREDVSERHAVQHPWQRPSRKLLCGRRALADRCPGEENAGIRPRRGPSQPDAHRLQPPRRQSIPSIGLDRLRPPHCLAGRALLPAKARAPAVKACGASSY